MSELLAFQNGALIPAGQLSVPVFDGGFVQGTTVAEQIRTCDGKLFRLDEHLARFANSLACIRVTLPYAQEQLADWATQLARHNHAQLEIGDDLSLCLFATPGPYSSYAAAPGVVPDSQRGPLVAMHTFPLPFANWVTQYDEGQHLVIVSTREVPNSCWPSALKCRSRMHYYLADLEARDRDPRARALLLDVQGRVAEASTASVFLYREGEGFIAPPTEDILPSISLQTIREFAAHDDIPFVHRPIEPDEVFAADEVLLCSTSPCVLPCTVVDGRPISQGEPGPRYRRLVDQWSSHFGFSIVEQAQRFTQRPAAAR